MQWKQSGLLEGYWISDTGLLISPNGRLIKFKDNGHGYMSCNARPNRQQVTMYQHRLVAEAFIPNPNGYPEVNHIDEVRSNNSVDNLEWISIKANREYGNRNRKTRDKLIERGKSRKILATFKDGNTRLYNGSREVSLELGVGQNQVLQVLRGDRNSWFGIVFTDYKK